MQLLFSIFVFVPVVAVISIIIKGIKFIEMHVYLEPLHPTPQQRAPTISYVSCRLTHITTCATVRRLHICCVQGSPSRADLRGKIQRPYSRESREGGNAIRRSGMQFFANSFASKSFSGPKTTAPAQNMWSNAVQATVYCI